MERRFVAWLAISFGILILYWSFVAPPPPPEVGDGIRQGAEAGGEDAADTEQPPLEGAPPEPPVDDPAAEEQIPLDAPDVPLQFATLGSVDPEGSYRMLLTFTNEGAALVRAELADPHYRDLHDRAGYLGSLEPATAEAGGALVRVVGPGTPAAAAGLRPGDVIKAIGEQAIQTADDLQTALDQTKPWQTIAVRFERDGQLQGPVDVRLIRPPQEVMRPELENLLSRQEAVPQAFYDQPSFVLTLERAGDERLERGERELPQVDLLQGHWEIVPRDADPADYLLVPQDADEIVFRKLLPELRAEVYKRYRVARSTGEAGEENAAAADQPAYHFELDVAVRNLGNNAQTLAWRLDGPTGLPTEGWWYINRIGRGWFESSGLRDVVARFENRATRQFSARAIAEEDDDLKGGRPLVYSGVDSLYFAAVILPKKEQLTETWFENVEAVLLEPELAPSDNLAFSNVTCRLIRNAITLGASESHSDSFTIFCGPKQPALLANYQPAGQPDYALDDLVYYGWFWWVAKPMLGILGLFYDLVGNYGIAIIMLTVLVRACMLPLSLKQARNMAKMQELQPEMQRIAEKYKGDMEKRARAQQELFRKHNYNPMGGCLMAFVQLPIFVGLYRGLMLDVELRQAPLFTEAIRFASNLGAPDMLLDWSAWMPQFIQGFLGPYLNILPIITIFLFLLQQKLFMPPPTNEQAALQQKIMKFMMIFIGFLFYKVASGLCLYFIASSLWGIIERKLIPHPTRQEEAPASTGEPPTGGKRAKKVAPSDRPRPGRNGHPTDKSRAKAKRKR